MEQLSVMTGPRTSDFCPKIFAFSAKGGGRGVEGGGGDKKIQKRIKTMDIPFTTPSLKHAKSIKNPYSNHYTTLKHLYTRV